MTTLQSLEAKVNRLDSQLGSLLRNSNLTPALNDSSAVLVGSGAVDTPQLADSAVSVAKLASGAAVGSIAANEIPSTKIESLAADKIVAGSGIINDLTVAATITLGSGGAITLGSGGAISIGSGGYIEDADGSRWDQNVLRLVSAGAEGDAFVFAAGGDDQAYISADDSQHAIFGLVTGQASEPTSLLLRDGDLVLGFEGLGFNTLRPRVMVTTAGVAVTGNTAPDFASGVIGLFIAEALSAPSGTPVGGGVLFVESGALKFRTSGGNTRTVAAA